jgi:hypothetical protein
MSYGRITLAAIVVMITYYVGVGVELVEALGQLIGWSLAGVAIGLVYRPAATSRA